jgi:hypothetical protein
MDATTLLITVYCLIDDSLGGRQLRRRGPQPILADSEVLTIECVGEFLGLDTDKACMSTSAATGRLVPGRHPQDQPGKHPGLGDLGVQQHQDTVASVFRPEVLAPQARTGQRLLEEPVQLPPHPQPVHVPSRSAGESLDVDREDGVAYGLTKHDGALSRC